MQFSVFIQVFKAMFYSIFSIALNDHFWDGNFKIDLLIHYDPKFKLILEPDLFKIKIVFNGFNFILGTDIVSLRGYTQDALYPDNVGGIIYDKLVT